MKEFTYTIQDRLGIHARPAGILSKIAQNTDSLCMLSHNDRTVNLKKVFALMSMGIKCGDKIIVTVEGADEEEILEKIRRVLEENL